MILVIPNSLLKLVKNKMETYIWPNRNSTAQNGTKCCITMIHHENFVRKFLKIHKNSRQIYIFFVSRNTGTES